MGGFTIQILLGSLSLPGDGIVRIILLTQVKTAHSPMTTVTPALLLVSENVSAC